MNKISKTWNWILSSSTNTRLYYLLKIHKNLKLHNIGKIWGNCQAKIHICLTMNQNKYETCENILNF